MTPSRPRPLVLEPLESRLTPTISFGGGNTYAGDGSYASAVAAGDLNGDGYDDMVLAAAAGGTVSYLSNASGILTPVATVPIGDTRGLLLVDMNGDTKLDIAAANGAGQQAVVALGNGDGTFQKPIATSIGANALEIGAGDFDGDGRMDLAVTRGGVVVLHNNGTPSLFDPPVQIVTGADDEGIVVGDVNGDGKPDIVTGLYVGDAIHVMLNNGDGTFAAPSLYPLAWHAGQMAIGDLNNDGRDDVVVSYHGGASFAILLANADGTLQPRVEYVPNLNAPGPGGVALGDFDADGNLDLMVALPGSNRARAYTGHGDGTFSDPITVSTGGTPSDLALGDFNGDGLLDLASSNSVSPASVTLTLNTTVVSLAAFEVSAPATATAGQSVTVTVTARTPGGSTFAGFTGAVQLTSTDGQATFPGTVTFTAADRGVKTVTVTFGTVGSQTITATDLSTSSAGTSNAVAVANSPVVRAAATLTLTALDGPTVFGDTARFLVAVAQVGNSPVPSGTIRFTNAATHEVLGDVSLDATGRAVLSTAMLPAGTNTIAASYSGDAAYLQAGGVTVTQVVDRQARTAVGSDAGPVTTVQVFDPRTGALLRTLFPFDQYTLGVKVATGDVNGDGISDIVVSAGAGAPGGHVKVYNGINYAVLASFFTFPGYTGGVNVGVGDVDDDGFGDVVVGTAVANDHVKAFSSRLLLTGASADFSTIQSFFAYGGGNPVGVTVGTGDVDGDGRADIVTGSATFAGHVKAFSGAGNGNLIGSYFAYGAGYLGGIYVAGGDLDGDGRAEIITGATNAPHVKALRLNGAEVANFFAYLNADGTPANFGVRVGAVDRNRDRLADVLTGSGGAAPAVKTFSGLDPAVLLESFIATPPGQSPSASGIFVAGSGR